MSVKLHDIKIPGETLATFCRVNGIRRTPAELHPAFREDVLRTAMDEYVAA